MKHIFLFAISIICLNNILAQSWKDFPMKPEMTEIWDPEVEVVTPGETPADAP